MGKMSVAARLLQKIQLLTNLSILVWVSILGTVNRGLGNSSTLDKALDLIEAEVGGILLLDEKSQTLSYRAHHSGAA